MQKFWSGKGDRKRLNVGDWVEVRSKDEILETLDERGQLDGMPFMPQMFQYCGQRGSGFYKRAHKTCGTITGYDRWATAARWNPSGPTL